jgi:aspartyl aminopeptidase
MQINPEHRNHTEQLLRYIDASPSPWHAVAVMARQLSEQGYMPLNEQDAWSLTPGSRHYVIRGGSSLIAFVVGTGVTAESGFRIIGAHTDSPGLRLKPKAWEGSQNLLRLGVETYGGPILATFADRDLSIAGRICLRTAQGISSQLIRFDHPLVRLPNLAIHMNRKVNDEGLKFNKQSELPLIMAALEQALPPREQFLGLLARRADCEPSAIMSFDLAVYDTQAGAFWGPAAEFIASRQIDNLSSCHAGLTALLNVEGGEHTSLGAFFDHEEIGSESHKGADGSFLSDILERIAISLGTERQAYKQALARSFMISADAAHACHPNFPGAYEPLHSIQVNGGPAVKINANQRYATDGLTEAQFMALCEQAEVPCQTYVHRSDLACGSTIGPMSAAQLGIPTVDCGCPMWAMHSARESAGVLDQLWLARLLKTFLECPTLP